MTEFAVPTPSGPARVDLVRPRAPRGLFVIGHGAGGGIDAPDIRIAAQAALGHAFAVARVTQPYRVAGRRTPAPAPKLDEAWLAVVSSLRRRRGLGSLPLVNAGRSSGARVACRTATDLGAVGVVCLAFPVHPPGKPEQTRLAELDQPACPVLVVQGARDPFGMPPERPERPERPGRRGSAASRTLIVIEGADHGLKKGAETIRDAVGTFLAWLAGVDRAESS